MFRLIGCGIRVWGCLFVAYWALVIGIAGVLIITSYLREPRHHPAAKILHDPRAKEQRPVALRGY